MGPTSNVLISRVDLSRGLKIFFFHQLCNSEFQLDQVSLVMVHLWPLIISTRNVLPTMVVYPIHYCRSRRPFWDQGMLYVRWTGFNSLRETLCRWPIDF